MYLHSFIDDDNEIGNPPAPLDEPPTLESRFEVDRLVLMVRDPYWVFAYWEVAPASLVEVRETAGESDYTNGSLALRVYQRNHEDIMIVDADVGAEPSMYLHLGRPDAVFIGVLGFRTESGGFFELARSAAVRAPRDTFAEEVSETVQRLILQEAAMTVPAPVGDILFPPPTRALLSPTQTAETVRYLLERQHLHELDQSWQATQQPFSAELGDQRYLGSG